MIRRLIENIDRVIAERFDFKSTTQQRIEAYELEQARSRIAQLEGERADLLHRVSATCEILETVLGIFTEPVHMGYGAIRRGHVTQTQLDYWRAFVATARSVDGL